MPAKVSSSHKSPTSVAISKIPSGNRYFSTGHSISHPHTARRPARLAAHRPVTLSHVAIYLLGLRGSGKTTVGKLVADERGVPFADLDHITPEILGFPSAADALRERGLQAFRDAERQALDDPRVLAAGIVSLGGGTPTHPPCEAELRRRAASGHTLIYLRASIETLRARLAATDLASRPSLTGADPLTEIPTLWAARDPLYRSLASKVIEVDGLTDREVAQRVMA